MFDIEKLEDAPKREKIRNRYRSHTAYKNFGHIYQFLESNVGELWSNVVSKFVKLDWIPTEYRTLSYLKHRVETSTYMENGKVFYMDGYVAWGRHAEVEIATEMHDVFYVHPVTQTLELHKKPKEPDYKKQHAEAEAKLCKILGDYHQLLKVKGIWYEVKAIIAPLGLGSWYAANARSRFKHWSDEDCHYSSKAITITSKHQLTTKELQKHGLKNEKPSLFFGKKCKICGGFGCILHKKALIS